MEWGEVGKVIPQGTGAGGKEKWVKPGRSGIGSYFRSIL